MKKYLKSNKSLERKKVLSWLKQLVSILKFLHCENNRPHRDLKSKYKILIWLKFKENFIQISCNRNIFIKNNKIKLADFGISKLIDGEKHTKLSEIEKPEYVSPEVFKNEKYDFKSDVW